MIALDEIREQPDVLQKWLESRLGSARSIAREIRSRGIEYVYLAARGTSDHAGIYAQYVWGALAGLPVALATPSLFTLYRTPPRLHKALVVGISQSGESPDIVQVIEEARRQGASTIALTNSTQSPLEKAAEFNLNLATGPERAVAASKTYTAELLAVAALGALLSKKEDLVDSLNKVPIAVRSALALEPEIQRKAAAYTGLTNCLVIGRGYNYCTAREWALKLKELTYIHAEAYSSADFLHGPIAVVEAGDTVIVVAPCGRAEQDILHLLATLRDEKRARVFLLSDDQSLKPSVQDEILLPVSIPEWLSPIVAIVPAQIFCVRLAEALGLDPDSPRGLQKVTRTL